MDAISIGLIIFGIAAVGLMAYGVYTQYNLQKEDAENAKKSADESAQASESAEYKCKNYPAGVSNFMTYSVVPMVNKEYRDDGYILKGRTKKLGIPYFCKPRPPSDENDKAGECDPDKEILYYLGGDNENFIMPENWKDNPNSKFSDYYFKKKDGKIGGITPDEAAMECYSDSGCGTVYLPSCEIGYRYVSKRTLNEMAASDPTIKDKAASWKESGELFADGEFRNHSCVKINAEGAKSQAGKEPDSVDTNWMEFLDFSDVRTLNIKERPNRSESPARAAYFYKKSFATDSSTAGTGPAAKQRSTNDGGDYTFMESSSGKNRPTDHVMIQYWTGNPERTYEPIPEKDTPCEAVNASMPRDDKEECEKAIPGWTKQVCSKRAESKRVV